LKLKVKRALGGQHSIGPEGRVQSQFSFLVAEKDYRLNLVI